MSDATRGRIGINLADGERFDDWQTFSMTERFDDPLGSYDLVIRPPRGRLRFLQQVFQRGELISIKIDENPRATPIILTTKLTVDKSSSIVMNVKAVSVLHIATQASADPEIFQTQPADVSVVDLILRVLAPFGFSEIIATTTEHTETVLGKALNGRAPDIKVLDLKDKEAQVKENEGAYQYCARLFSRLGVALRVNYEGRLLLQAPDYDQVAAYTIVEDREGSTSGDPIISISLDETNDGQYSKVVVRGKSEEKRKKKQTAQPRAATVLKKLVGRFATPEQEAAAEASFEASNNLQPFGDAVETLIDPDQPLYTSSVQPFKPRYWVEKRVRDNERCESFCKLVHTKNSPKAFMVTATVEGIVSRSSGAIWAVDTICRVFSDTFALNDDMWIYEVQMKVEKGGGARTTLKLLPKGALILGDIPG